MKFRVLFEKKVYAYKDVEAETESDVWGKEDLYEEWEKDQFNYPDSDWQISSIKEAKQ
jgi:hypothetical protein